MIKIDLTGKIGLVTGASGGLGRSIVKTLAEAGADVAIHYRTNIEQANRLIKEINNIGVRAMIVDADITEFESVLRMRDNICQNLGAPDIVITSAIIQYSWKQVLMQEIEDYESQFRSNVLQNVFIAKAFIPSMMNKKWGRIIGINTECAMMNMPRQSAYVSGKRGMDGMLRVLAREVGPYGITVNQVAPGWTINENDIGGGSTEEYINKVPLRRRGTDSEVACVIAFFASDLAGFITGAYIPVCGGNIMPAI